MKQQKTEVEESGKSSEKKDTKNMRMSSLSDVKEKEKSSGESSVWGESRMTLAAWKNPKVFQKYLDGLKSAKRFANDKGMDFLYRLPATRRRRIFKRLREIDPEAVDKIAMLKRQRTARRTRAKREKKRMEEAAAVKRANEADQIAIANIDYREEGVTQFSFVDADCMLDIVAMLLCAGYEKKDIKKKFPKLDIKLIDKVDNNRMQKMKRKVPDAIIDAADKKVLRDLIDGEVTGSTTKADLIAHRRRKINIEKAKVIAGGRGNLLPSQEREKEKKLKDRFGFEKKPIDVKAEEIKDEDNATGTIDQNE